MSDSRTLRTPTWPSPLGIKHIYNKNFLQWPSLHCHNGRDNRNRARMSSRLCETIQGHIRGMTRFGKNTDYKSECSKRSLIILFHRHVTSVKPVLPKEDHPKFPQVWQSSGKERKKGSFLRGDNNAGQTLLAASANHWWISGDSPSIRHWHQWFQLRVQHLWCCIKKAGFFSMEMHRNMC